MKDRITLPDLTAIYPRYREMQDLECVCFYSERGATALLTQGQGRSRQGGVTLLWMKTDVL